MRLFADDAKVYYQEVLRTVGAFIEAKDFRDIRLIETESGLVVQGRMTRASGEVVAESYLLTVEDLHNMMREAYQKRGTGSTTWNERRIPR